MTMNTPFPVKQPDDLKKTPELGATLGDKAKNLTDSTVEKVKDAAGSVADTAKDAASSVGRQADRATHAVGSGIESLGHTLRETMPKKGMLGAATSSVADGLESSGKYIEEEGIKGMADDVTNLIRRNPVPALLVGVALGFIVGRLTSRS